MRDPETNPVLGQAMLEVVENQIRDNEPPETRQTIERLCAAGHTPEEARRLVAIAVSSEVYHIMRDHQPFNRKRFLRNLKRLPRLPWDKPGTESFKG